MVCVDDAGGSGVCSGNGVCDTVTNQCVCDAGYDSYGDLIYRPMIESSGSAELVTDCALRRYAVDRVHVMCLVLGVLAVVVMTANAIRRSFRTPHALATAGSHSVWSRVWARVSPYPNRLFALGVATELGTIAYSTSYFVTRMDSGAHAPGITHSLASTLSWIWWCEVVNFLATDLSYQIVHTFLTAGTVHLSHSDREAITPVLNVLKRTLRYTWAWNSIGVFVLAWVNWTIQPLTDHAQVIVASFNLAVFGFAVANDNILTFIFSRRIAAALRAHYHQTHTKQQPLPHPQPQQPSSTAGGVTITVAPVTDSGGKTAPAHAHAHAPPPNSNTNANSNAALLVVASQMEGYAWFLVPIFLGMPVVLMLAACWPYLRSRSAYVYPACLSMASIALSGTTFLYVPNSQPAATVVPVVPSAASSPIPSPAPALVRASSAPRAVPASGVPSGGSPKQ